MKEWDAEMPGVRDRAFRCRTAGVVEKRVTCEACGRDYYYVVEREALDGTIDFLVLDAALSEDAAGDVAREKVNHALARIVKIVPCPHCGHYQREMLPLIRDSYYPYARFLAFAMLFLAMLIATIAFLLKDRIRDGLLPNWAWMVCGSLVGGGLFVLVLRHTIASREDPNAEQLEERLALGRSRAVVIDTPDDAGTLTSSATGT